jgi:hypothetical protein
VGFDTPSKTTGKTAPDEKSGAKSGALSADSGVMDSDLGRLIAAWPTLPDAIRRAMLALVAG